MIRDEALAAYLARLADLIEASPDFNVRDLCMCWIGRAPDHTMRWGCDRITDQLTAEELQIHVGKLLPMIAAVEVSQGKGFTYCLGEPVSRRLSNRLRVDWLRRMATHVATGDSEDYYL